MNIKHKLKKEQQGWCPNHHPSPWLRNRMDKRTIRGLDACAIEMCHCTKLRMYDCTDKCVRTQTRICVRAQRRLYVHKQRRLSMCARRCLCASWAVLEKCLKMYLKSDCRIFWHVKRHTAEFFGRQIPRSA